MSAHPEYDEVTVPLALVRAPAVVTATNLSKRYGQGDARVEALRDVSLEIEEGRLTAIMGPSGSGKSTLMHLLAGLDQPSEGTVSIAGVEISSMSDAELTKLRRQHIGFVFQFYNLLPMLTAQENVLLPLQIAGVKPDRKWVEELLETVGINGRRTHRPSELSGGQQQRVSIARALVTRPTVLFADEPTGNLDSTTSRDVLALLRHSVDEFGQTTVMVTHDPQAAALADRILFLADGRIVKEWARDALSPTHKPGRGCWLLLHDVDNWEARIGVEAGGGEQRGADVSVEERVAATAVRGSDPLRLREGVDGEAARPLEPALVAGARERLEEREAVTRGAVAEAVALLVAVGARTPDELGAGEQEVLVEILPGAGDDTWRAGAPLETDPTVSWPRELRTRRAGPVGEAVLAERMSRENGRALARDGSVWLETEQSECVSRDAV
jgi:putative ABC transport system ATP-binding protein